MSLLFIIIDLSKLRITINYILPRIFSKEVKYNNVLIFVNINNMNSIII